MHYIVLRGENGKKEISSFVACGVFKDVLDLKIQIKIYSTKENNEISFVLPFIFMFISFNLLYKTLNLCERFLEQYGAPLHIQGLV